MKKLLLNIVCLLVAACAPAGYAQGVPQNIQKLNGSLTASFLVPTGVTIQASGSGAIIATSLSGSYVGQTSITTLGTITTGVWNGTSIPVIYGGTGGTSKVTGFNGLSPMTTIGDMIYGSTSGSGVRLPIGSSGQVLQVVAGIPAWVTFSSGGTVNSGTTDQVAVYNSSGTAVTGSSTIQNLTSLGIGTAPTSVRPIYLLPSFTAGAGFSAYGIQLGGTAIAHANNDAMRWMTIGGGTATFSTGGFATLTQYMLEITGSSSAGGGTISNSYGVYVDIGTQGTNNWAFYAQTGKAKFKGASEFDASVLIGTGGGVPVSANEPFVFNPVISAGTVFIRGALFVPAITYISNSQTAKMLTIGDGAIALNTATFTGLSATALAIDGISKAGTGTIDNYYAIKIANATLTATNTYSIYTGFGRNFFGGNVGIVAGGYLNFDTTDGSSGYGFRDNGGVMEVKSSGGSWGAIGAGISNPLTTKGDIFVGGASGTPSRLPIGTDTWVLTADASQTLGMKWAVAGAGGTPGGSNTQLQYNNSSAFGGISGATTNGTAVTYTASNLIATQPRFITSVDDTNGNEIFKITATASAVNEFTFANAATTTWPTITASGGDTNIILALNGKGTGGVMVGDVTGTIASGAVDRLFNVTGSNAVLNITRTGSGSAGMELKSRSTINSANLAYWDMYVNSTGSSTDDLTIRGRLSSDVNVMRFTRTLFTAYVAGRIEYATAAGLVIQASTASGYSSFRLYNDQNSGSRAVEQGYTGSTFSGAPLTGGVTGESGYTTTTGNFGYSFGTNNTARINVSNAGVVTIVNTTAASSTTTGALVNSGGLGVAGAAYIGGLVNIVGDLQLAKTITAGGTTGNQTINKTTGSVNFAAAATSLTVTNSLVTTSSVINITVATNDTTMKSAVAVAGAGSFVITANAAATAETRVNFVVTN